MTKVEELLRIVHIGTEDPVVLTDGVLSLLARVWAEGYEAGVTDGCNDVLIGQESPNPYMP